MVDEDIDVFNEPQVMWAVGTRFRAEKDLTVIPDFSGPGGLNPSNWEYGVDESRKPVKGSAMILDATMPAPPLRFPPRTKPPENLVSRVEPEKLLKRFDPKLVKS